MASSKQFKASIVLGGSVAGSLKTAFGSVEGGVKRIGAEITQLRGRQELLSKSIKTFTSIGTDRTRWNAMRTNYAQVTAQVDRLRAAQSRMIATQARYNALSATAVKMRGAAYGMGFAAVAIGAPVMSTLKEAKAYSAEEQKIKALGLGDAATSEATKFATGMKTFGTSIVQNMELMRDATAIFGDVHHAEMAAPVMAQMKFANAAIYGKEHGAENDAKFYDMLKVVELRGGVKSQADFKQQANYIQKVLSGTGGRVGPDEWRHLIKTGGLAAKSMRDDAFYYQLEPLVQEMGGDKVGTGLMAGYSSLYQGRGTVRSLRNLDKLGLIGDRSKIKTDKVGQIAHIDPGALKGADIFRKSQYEWMKQVLLPTLAKKGLTSKDQVLDAIGSIFSNRKGADLMAAMYLQQMQIDKSEKLNRGAADIDTLDKQARGSTAGKELQAEAKLANLKLRMGTDILPIYTKGLELATIALESLNGFMESHPKLSKVMSVSLGVLAAGLGVLAPVILTVSYVLVPLAKSIGFVTTALKFLGRSILTNPIFLIAAAIGVVVYEIYQHWDGFKAFFVKLWDDVSNIFGGQLKFLKGLFTGDFRMMIDGVKQMFVGFKSFVTDIFKGITDGLGTVVDDALEAMGLLDKKKRELEVGKEQADKETKQRHGLVVDTALAMFNPGALVMDGVDALRGKDKPADAIKWNTGAADDAQPAAPSMPSMPPMATARGSTPAAAPVQQYNVYHITQQPGEDGASLARRITEQQHHGAGVQQRGMLIDGVGG